MPKEDIPPSQRVDYNAHTTRYVYASAGLFYLYPSLYIGRVRVYVMRVSISSCLQLAAQLAVAVLGNAQRGEVQIAQLNSM